MNIHKPIKYLPPLLIIMLVPKVKFSDGLLFESDVFSLSCTFLSISEMAFSYFS